MGRMLGSIEAATLSSRWMLRISYSTTAQPTNCESSLLRLSGQQRLTSHRLVFAFDPTDSDPYVIPSGKQVLNPTHIYYTACSGIWQTVWLESVPSDHLTDLYINSAANGTVTGRASTSGNTTDGDITIVIAPRDNSTGNEQTFTVQPNSDFEITYNAPSPWTPDEPNLYNVTVTWGDDVVQSYTGFRTISRAVINDIERPLLNGEPFSRSAHWTRASGPMASIRRRPSRPWRTIF